MMRKFSCLLLTITIFHFQLFAQKKLTLIEQPVKLARGLSFKLKVPAGYSIHVAKEGLERPRFFSKSPDGRLFITDMHDRDDNRLGRILILEDWDEQAKQFKKTTTFLDSLHNPNQVAFYTVAGKHYLYVAETGQLSFYSYRSGDSMPSSMPTVVARFPDYGLNYKYGGWHLTRSIDFHNGKLYVSVGSSCDACIEKEDEIRAAIVEMDPDGKNMRYYARGLRNAVGMKWINNKLWVTNMGRDNRGPDKPEDLLHSIRENAFYGWPYFYQFNKQILADTAFIDSLRPAFVKTPPVAPWSFKAHSAPLGFAFTQGFCDANLDSSFLVALHGSTSVWRQRGNSVVQMLPGGRSREIVTGFLQGKTENKRYGRPCDIIQWDKRSFFISDDKNGVIYYLFKL